MDLSHKIAGFVAGAVASAFGAGVTFAVWDSSHPNKVQIAEMFYDTRIDAYEARKSTMQIEADIKALRKDLSRGFGRAYEIKRNSRDDAGKRAVLQYEREISRGVPHAEALQHVIEESLLPRPDDSGF